MSSDFCFVSALPLSSFPLPHWHDPVFYTCIRGHLGGPFCAMISCAPLLSPGSKLRKVVGSATSRLTGRMRDGGDPGGQPNPLLLEQFRCLLEVEAAKTPGKGYSTYRGVSMGAYISCSGTGACHERTVRRQPPRSDAAGLFPLCHDANAQFLRLAHGNAAMRRRLRCRLKCQVACTLSPTPTTAPILHTAHTWRPEPHQVWVSNF